MTRRLFTCWIAAAGFSAGTWLGAVPGGAADDSRPAFETLSLRGRVVFVAEALHRLYGIESDPDAAQSQVALETPEGRLYPLVKDARGRGFFKDARLRELDLELLVRRYEGAPAVQVVQVYTLHDGARFELDYWCDVCAIPMYELKDCECCQGPTRLRERRVADDRPGDR
jgi:hypothetical protein